MLRQQLKDLRYGFASDEYSFPKLISSSPTRDQGTMQYGSSYGMSSSPTPGSIRRYSSEVKGQHLKRKRVDSGSWITSNLSPHPHSNENGERPQSSRLMPPPPLPVFRGTHSRSSRQGAPDTAAVPGRVVQDISSSMPSLYMTTTRRPAVESRHCKIHSVEGAWLGRRQGS